jgi:hypothetical protein
MTKEEAITKAKSLMHLKGKTFNVQENKPLQPPNEIMGFGVRKKDASLDLYEVEIMYYETNSGIAFHESYDNFLKTHVLPDK